MVFAWWAWAFYCVVSGNWWLLAVTWLLLAIYDAN